ncbi:MAG: 30S ribosomal protein S5 [Nanoarchaeota archaeon]
MARRFQKRMERSPVDLSKWIPRTDLGRKVMNGEIKSIHQIFELGHVIREPEIIDYLFPTLSEEIIYIGGMPGKGGGKMRTPLRITTRMHRSGRRRTIHALMAVGNKNGVVGIGYAIGKDAKSAIEKAGKQARLSVMLVRRGCGSWECNCCGTHSIPFKALGKRGSVKVTLIPAPKGIELGVADEIKKVMRLAGIRDLWMKSRGDTGTRVNFVLAVFEAFRNLNKLKADDEAAKVTGMKLGIIDAEPKAETA